jgi:hypothetical protein
MVKVLVEQQNLPLKLANCWIYHEARITIKARELTKVNHEASSRLMVPGGQLRRGPYRYESGVSCTRKGCLSSAANVAQRSPLSSQIW